jgi:ADP-ribosylglycohydrolase
MHTLLPQLARRNAWRTAPGLLFGGQGSFGNGSAMRVTPVGAYFADDLDVLVEHARRSALVTHTHPEAVAGAIAVAAAAAWAWRLREGGAPSPRDFLDLVLPSVPESEVRRRVARARDLEPRMGVNRVVMVLGNGSEVTAQDTVPFVLWAAAQYPDSYEKALWLTASGLGDVDTTCAMVGGIVVMRSGLSSIPEPWLHNREPLPQDVLWGSDSPG